MNHLSSNKEDVEYTLFSISPISNFNTLDWKLFCTSLQFLVEMDSFSAVKVKINPLLTIRNRTLAYIKPLRCAKIKRPTM